MKTFTNYLSVFLFIAATNVSMAQKNDNGQPIIDRFFQLYEKEGHESALNYAFGTNKWMGSNADGIKNVILELDKSVSLIGDYVDREEIKSKSVGTRYRIASYFVYYDRQPLRFTFQLYKNQDGWMLWNFQFDSDWDNEVEEAMKLYRFKELSDWNE